MQIQPTVSSVRQVRTAQNTISPLQMANVIQDTIVPVVKTPPNLRNTPAVQVICAQREVTMKLGAHRVSTNRIGGSTLATTALLAPSATHSAITNSSTR